MAASFSSGMPFKNANVKPRGFPLADFKETLTRLVSSGFGSTFVVSRSSFLVAMKKNVEFMAVAL
jgi:hypothetical protein